MKKTPYRMTSKNIRWQTHSRFASEIVYRNLLVASGLENVAWCYLPSVMFAKHVIKLQRC